MESGRADTKKRTTFFSMYGQIMRGKIWHNGQFGQKKEVSVYLSLSERYRECVLQIGDAGAKPIDPS